MDTFPKVGDKVKFIGEDTCPFLQIGTTGKIIAIDEQGKIVWNTFPSVGESYNWPNKNIELLKNENYTEEIKSIAQRAIKKLKDL